MQGKPYLCTKFDDFMAEPRKAGRRTVARAKVNVPEEDAYGHVQPQAVEFEEAVLGALMIEQDAYSQVSEILRPESFYDHRHQLIYEAIRTLNFQQKPVDILTVTEFLKDGKGNVQKAKIISLEPKQDKKSGRMIMSPVEGTEKTMDAQLVLIAAGFLGSQKYVTDAFQTETDPRTNVKTKSGAYETTVPRVFTAGDMHRGQSLVVWAIAEGRNAARAVDRDLMGY